MFRWLNKQGVESTSGFVLQSMDRFFYHYTEADRVLQVNVEPLTDVTGRYREQVYVSSLQRWQPPFGEHLIPESEQQRIRANISAALEFMGIAHEFS